jgi:thioredoxin-related protein
LARQNPALNVIGLGGQDSFDYAIEFVETTQTGGGEITMLWDPSFDSWRAYGVRSQPYWILYDAAGNEVASRPGAVDIAAVAAVLTT